MSVHGIRVLIVHVLESYTSFKVHTRLSNAARDVYLESDPQLVKYCIRKISERLARDAAVHKVICYTAGRLCHKLTQIHMLAHLRVTLSSTCKCDRIVLLVQRHSRNEMS